MGPTSFFSKEDLSQNVEDTPLLNQYIQQIWGSIDERLHPLAKRALGTNFHPHENETVTALATNSFRQQWQYLIMHDHTLPDRFQRWGVGAIIDSVKQQDVNLASDNNLGDAYILRNLESIVCFAKDKDLDVMVGRYAGDELIAFFIPKSGVVDSQALATEFGIYNKNRFETSNHPTDQKLLALLPKLREVHGEDLQIGATIKTVKLDSCTFTLQKNIRERQLLSEVIDHAEYRALSGDTYLAKELINNWDTPNQLSSEHTKVELDQLETLLPDTIYQLYQDAIKSGIEPTVAAAYAEAATFEGMYPRMQIYRMEVYLDLVAKHKKLYGNMIVVKSADPYLKWTNKHVSHRAGDTRMLKLAKLSNQTYYATIQHHGSFLHLIPEALYEKYVRECELTDSHQPDPHLNSNNQHPDAFRVTTNYVSTANDPKHILKISHDTTDHEVLEYVDILNLQQALNEITTLLIRAGITTQALVNLITYLIIRPNKAILATEILSEHADIYDPNGDILAAIMTQVNSGDLQ